MPETSTTPTMPSRAERLRLATLCGEGAAVLALEDALLTMAAKDPGEAVLAVAAAEGALLSALDSAGMSRAQRREVKRAATLLAAARAGLPDLPVEVARFHGISAART